MSKGFTEKWKEKENQTSISERIKTVVRPSKPLKPSLDFAMRRIEHQIQRLNQASDKFNKRDKSIFACIVEAYSKHDVPRAVVFANELAELRKTEKTIMHAQLALEQVVLRLKTITELGDVVTTLAPAVSVLHGVKNGMANVFPQAEKELGQIGNLLSGVMLDTGQSTDLTIDFENANEDAQKILNEATAAVEERIKEKLPESPVQTPTSEKTDILGT